MFKANVPPEFAADWTPHETQVIELFDIFFEPDREETIEIDAHGGVEDVYELEVAC